MLSGRAARGRSSAADSGETGRTPGGAFGGLLRRFPVLIVQVASSGEEQRRQPAAAGQCRLVGWTPSLEKPEELLAGLVLLPTPVLGEDFKQRVDCAGAIATGVPEEGEIEPGLMVPGIGGQAAVQRGLGSNR